jgi:predicted GNAT family N-acyltransferase
MSEASTQAFRTVVATDPKDINRAFAIRAAVYMIEQDCPYEEEFDGNDYCAMHLLGFLGDEPVATARLRFFGGFAKLERVAVMPRYRRLMLVPNLVDEAFEICSRKGFDTVYAQIQKRLEGFWRKAGFERLGKNRSLVFSDHEYIEVIKKLVPHPERITLDTDPIIIVRPEGSWDTQGVLDKSSARPALSPHGKENLHAHA